MYKQCVAVLLACMVAIPGSAAEQEGIHASWQEFRDQAAARQLVGHSARVVLSTGKSATTDILRIDEESMTVRETRAFRAWRSEAGQARIPKTEVRSVRFTGRTGKRRLLGAMAGLGAGAGIGAAIATTSDISEGPGVIVLPVIGAGIAILGAVGGYFIGRSMDKPRPEFIVTQ